LSGIKAEVLKPVIVPSLVARPVLIEDTDAIK
jgi:hypothetical protein